MNRFIRPNNWYIKKFCLLNSVVKEEIVDDDAHLPCFNGRVVSWVRFLILIDKFYNLIFIKDSYQS